MDPETLDLLRRSLDLRLDTEGRWLFEGRPLENERVGVLFSQGIDLHTESGEPILRVANQWAYFKADDTAFVVWRLTDSPDGLVAHLNTGLAIQVGPAFQVSDEGVLYLPFGADRLARLCRGAQAALVDAIEEGPEGPEVRRAGQTYPIKPRP